MRSHQIIKVYGELHGAEFLPEAYYQIFVDAQKIGATLCFIERSPYLQSDTDEIMQSLSTRSKDDLLQETNYWKAEYNSGHNERDMLAYFYRCCLCTLANIKLVHVDVAYRPLCMEVRHKARKLSPVYSLQALKDAAEKIDLMEYAGNPDHTLAQLQQELEDIKRDLTDEVIWWSNFHKKVKCRMDGDCHVTESILSNLESNPAIVIYGKNHTDLDRPNSIASLLAATEGIKLGVYHIVGINIIPRFEKGVENNSLSNSVYAPVENPTDFPAMVDLGKNYYHGIGQTKDLLEARYWFKKASKQGSAEADYYLSLCYLDDWDMDKAFAFAHKAADQAYIKAYILLGQFYYNGYGTAQDEVISHAWYYKAAESHDLSAAAFVAYNYLQGCGVEKDAFKSFIWYSIAATQKDENAIRNIKFAEKRLTPDQIAEARIFVEHFLSNKTIAF